MTSSQFDEVHWALDTAVLARKWAKTNNRITVSGATTSKLRLITRHLTILVLCSGVDVRKGDQKVKNNNEQEIADVYCRKKLNDPYKAKKEKARRQKCGRL